MVVEQECAVFGVGPFYFFFLLWPKSNWRRIPFDYFSLLQLMCVWVAVEYVIPWCVGYCWEIMAKTWTTQQSVKDPILRPSARLPWIRIRVIMRCWNIIKLYNNRILWLLYRITKQISRNPLWEEQGLSVFHRNIMCNKCSGSRRNNTKKFVLPRGLTDIVPTFFSHCYRLFLLLRLLSLPRSIALLRRLHLIFYRGCGLGSAPSSSKI